jgi:hypothetical protein
MIILYINRTVNFKGQTNFEKIVPELFSKYISESFQEKSIKQGKGRRWIETTFFNVFATFFNDIYLKEYWNKLIITNPKLNFAQKNLNF